MKVSLEWLSEYVDLPADLEPKTLAHDLTMSTVEVEQVIHVAASLRDVVLGAVVSVRPHDEGKGLSVVEVDAGGATVQVVSAATNLREGLRVPFAGPGAIVFDRDGNETTITETKVAGVESHGMICAGTELGQVGLLGSSDDGLAPDLAEWGGEPGDDLAGVLGLDDVVLEIDNKSLTNRPDLWCHHGVARELAAIYDLPLKEPTVVAPPTEDGGLVVEIESPELCGRYTATLVEGVPVEAAPTWMRSRLARVDQRPINLLVDLTNYVMMSVGQPSHAFDARDVEGVIKVRPARPAESITLLDASSHELEERDLVIANAERAIALAGVMGGEDAVRDDTASLLLEVASFDPTGVRRTATRHGLRTESSSRFEKGIDPARVDLGLGMLLALLGELCPDAKVQATKDAFPRPAESVTVRVKVDTIERRLGQALGQERILGLLDRLGFSTVAEGGELVVSVPSWRATGDVSLPADIVEEVGRLHGYERFDFVPPRIELTEPVLQPRPRLSRRLLEYFAHRGQMREIKSAPWTHEKWLDASGLEEPRLALATPPSPEERWLQASLVPPLLQAIASNLRWSTSFRVFELARVFRDESWATTEGSSESLPHQPRHLAGALVGDDAAALFLEAKGLLEGLRRGVHVEDLRLVTGVEVPWAEPAGCLGIAVGERVIGAVGVLASRTRRLADLRRAEAVVFELDVDALEPLPTRDNRYAALPLYPEVDYDVSFLVDRATTWERVVEVAGDVDPLVRRVSFVDQYVGEQVSGDRKSVTLRLFLRSDEGTLVREQIDAAASQVMDRLKETLGAEIRSA
ncbi:MAG: phenylalanine--tRNA ligase subunit beta [Acidobacteriota bacterium]